MTPPAPTASCCSGRSQRWAQLYVMHVFSYLASTCVAAKPCSCERLTGVPKSVYACGGRAAQCSCAATKHRPHTTAACISEHGSSHLVTAAGHSDVRQPCAAAGADWRPVRPGGCNGRLYMFEAQTTGSASTCSMGPADALPVPVDGLPMATRTGSSLSSTAPEICQFLNMPVPSLVFVCFTYLCRTWHLELPPMSEELPRTAQQHSSALFTFPAPAQKYTGIWNCLQLSKQQQ